MAEARRTVTPAGDREAWPALPLEAWRDTCATLDMWTQIVGKVRMALAPEVNHWWHVPLYVSARGLTSFMSLRTVKRKVPDSEVSSAVRLTSPSPCTPWPSPVENRPPSANTGR